MSTFGEDLKYGFDVQPDDVPMLRECIEKQSMEPMEKHLDSLDLENKHY